MKYFLMLLTTLVLAVPNAYALNLPSEQSGNHETLCKEKWTKRGILDQRMYNFCADQQHEGYLNLVALANKYSSQKWIQDAINFSVKKWTKRDVRDDQMAHHALEQITEGWENLLYTYKQPKFNQSKYNVCINKWGVEFNMAFYCYSKD